MNQAVVFKILDHFDLGYEHIFYWFGGQGRILIPNRNDVDKSIDELNKLLQRFVNYRHQGITQLVLSYDIYDDKEIKNDVFYHSLNQEERISLPGIKHKPEIFTLQYDLLERWLNHSNQIYAYSFVNKEGELSLGELGSVTKTTKFFENCYYLSLSQYRLGDTLYHNYMNRLTSFENWVIVKKDIVNLTHVFLDGIQKEHQIISKFMSISRYLELFFSKIIGEICKNEKLYLIYSGGDDIIFTCCNHDALGIVTRIFEAFNHYVHGNPSLSLSYSVEEVQTDYYTAYQNVNRNLRLL